MRRCVQLLVSMVFTAGAQAGDPVRRHALPEGAMAPDVAVQGQAVHVTYGLSGDAWYQRSEDGGRTFGAPVRVNDRAGDVLSGLERGPRLALGGDGTVHVVWSPERLLGVRYARRTAGQDEFEAARDLRYEGAEAAEGVAVAAHERAVLVVWLDGKSGEPANSPVGLPLWGRVSRDGGATFEPAAALAHDYGGGACACCHLSAATDADGRFVVAFRGARGGVRDVFALRGDRTGQRFASLRLTRDEWQLRGCPMDGPRITRAGEGLLVSHSVDGRVGWSELRGGRAREPVRPGEARGKFPLVLRSERAVCLAWLEGGEWRWVVQPRGAEPVEGTLDLPAGSRAAGFVDGEGGFVLVG